MAKKVFRIPFRWDGDSAVWTFPNLGEVRYDTTTGDENLQISALRNGYKQKLSDTMAGLETLEEKFEAMTACAERLRANVWNAPRDSDGTTPVGGILWLAVQRALPGRFESLGEFRLYVANKSATSGHTTGQIVAALRKMPKISAAISAIEAERGDSIDVDEVLSDLSE